VQVKLCPIGVCGLGVSQVCWGLILNGGPEKIPDEGIFRELGVWEEIKTFVHENANSRLYSFEKTRANFFIPGLIYILVSYK
jgi:hypothetical protein